MVPERKERIEYNCYVSGCGIQIGRQLFWDARSAKREQRHLADGALESAADYGGSCGCKNLNAKRYKYEAEACR